MRGTPSLVALDAKYVNTFSALLSFRISSSYWRIRASRICSSLSSLNTGREVCGLGLSGGGACARSAGELLTAARVSGAPSWPDVDGIHEGQPHRPEALSASACPDTAPETAPAAVAAALSASPRPWRFRRATALRMVRNIVTPPALQPACQPPASVTSSPIHALHTATTARYIAIGPAETPFCTPCTPCSSIIQQQSFVLPMSTGGGGGSADSYSHTVL